jgi:hypothetical protein
MMSKAERMSKNTSGKKSKDKNTGKTSRWDRKAATSLSRTGCVEFRYMPVIRKSIAAIISSLKVLSSLTGSHRILVGTLAI